jgi:hypothetical protein
MRTIDRSIAIIRPKKPYIAWANSCGYEDRAYSPEYFDDFYSMAFLIPYFDSITANKSKQHVVSKWEELFTGALSGWNKDKESWPKDLSAEMFKKWFKIEFLRTVVEL